MGCVNLLHINSDAVDGCVYAAQAQNIDLVQVKKDATAFLLDKDVEKDYSHIKFTVTKLDI